MIVLHNVKVESYWLKIIVSNWCEEEEKVEEKCDFRMFIEQK